MKVKIYTILILLFLIMIPACRPATVLPVATPSRPPDNPRKKSTPVPTRRDISYCTMDGVDLKMDIYAPESHEEMPAVIYIHGGSWAGGTKSSPEVSKDAPALLKAGMVVFSIDYRLAKAYRFPAMIEDVKCAVRSIRARAGEYNIDPNRIGAYGGSAGAHLAALLGTTDQSAGFDVGEYLEYSSRVQAVVDAFGPTDLIKQYRQDTVPEMSMVFLESDLERASPIIYVSPDDPPFLILHGTDDEMVLPEQSQDFYEALLANNVSAELVMVKNAVHGLGVSNREQPSRAEVSQIIADFFAKYLK